MPESQCVSCSLQGRVAPRDSTHLPQQVWGRAGTKAVDGTSYVCKCESVANSKCTKKMCKKCCMKFQLDTHGGYVCGARDHRPKGPVRARATTPAVAGHSSGARRDLEGSAGMWNSTALKSSASNDCLGLSAGCKGWLPRYWVPSSTPAYCN